MQNQIVRLLTAVAVCVFIFGVYSQLSRAGFVEQTPWKAAGLVGTTDVATSIQKNEERYQKTLHGRQWLLSQYKQPAPHSLFPAVNSKSYFETPFTVWDLFPATFNCPHSMQRIGRFGDGGKWTCGSERLEPLPRTRKVERTAAMDTPVAVQLREDFPTTGRQAAPGTQPGCIIYSFGVQFESSFEEEMLDAAPSCEVWGYDFSVPGWGPQLHEDRIEGRAHFTQLAIAGKTSLEGEPAFASIQDLMTANAHDHIDVLKIDIEGYEFDTLSSLLQHCKQLNQPVPISQILIEIHLDPGKFDTVEEVVAWWETLEAAGFRPVWTEPNLLSTTMGFHDGMTRYAEYTLINIKDPKSPFL